jgi:hypothetical protein
LSDQSANAAHGPDSRPVSRQGGAATRRLSSLKGSWKWGLAGLIGFSIGLFVGFSLNELPLARQPALPSMSQCMSDSFGSLGAKVPQTAEVLRDAREHCYSLIRAQGELDDFSVRKLNFFQQYRANGVLMWMVVAVTFSGVGLAGLQLWASYYLAFANRVALDGNDAQLILKRDQIALKSSITGLFILLISFCFFLVFVFYVYRFETLEDHGPIKPPISNVPMGELGPAPLKKN